MKNENTIIWSSFGPSHVCYIVFSLRWCDKRMANHWWRHWNIGSLTTTSNEGSNYAEFFVFDRFFLFFFFLLFFFFSFFSAAAIKWKTFFDYFFNKGMWFSFWVRNDSWTYNVRYHFFKSHNHSLIECSKPYSSLNSCCRKLRKKRKKWPDWKSNPRMPLRKFGNRRGPFPGPVRIWPLPSYCEESTVHLVFFSRFSISRNEIIVIVSGTDFNSKEPKRSSMWVQVP